MTPGLRASDRPTEAPGDDPTTRTHDAERRRDWRRALVRADVFEGHVDVHIGRYRVLHKLGHGGMGTVVAAHDQTLDRQVALKLLHEDLGHRSRQRVRLLREAQAMARVSHPHVVTVYEADVHEDQLFIAMELVDGITLDRWQRDRSRSWKECLGVYLQAGRGLEAAHAQQLVHRDFKPGNCIIDEAGRVRVLDFGLARDSTSGPVPAETIAVSHSSALTSSITRTGAMLGTVAYMSPEQLRGEPADARSDQFSFCVSLHEALFGHRPFMAETAGELLSAIVAGHEARVGHATSRVPASVRRVLRRGLRLDRQARYPSMAELLAALERIPRRRRWWALAAAGIAVSGALGAGVARLAMPTPRPCAAFEGQPPTGWDAQSRTAVEQAIVETGLDDAAVVWRGLSERLDAYAGEWSTLRHSACESAQIEQRTPPAIYEAQRICLEDRARVLGALTGRLRQADRAMAARAVAAAEALAPVAECQRLAVPVDDGPASIPPQLRGERDALLDRIAQVFVLERLGRHQQGLERIEGVVVAARALADRFEPPLYEALWIQGRLLRRSRRFDAAAEVLVEALPLAEGNGDDPRVLDLLHELMWLALDRDRVDEGRVWFHQAQAKLARLRGTDPSRERLVALDEGKLALASGQLDRAARVLEAMVHDCHAEADSAACLPGSLSTLALVREQQGLMHEAQALYEEALAERRRRGDLHGAGEVIYNLAGIYHDSDRPDDAVRTYREALALLSTFHDQDAPVVASARFGLANALWRRGDRAEALEHAQRAEQIFRRGGSTDDHLWALLLVADLVAEQGRPAEALEYFLRAEALIGEAEGVDPMSEAAVLAGIGDALRLLGRLPEAEPRVVKAVALTEQAMGLQHPALAYTLVTLGRLRLAQQRWPEAREALERAWSLQLHHGDRMLRAEAAHALATALWRTGETARAVELWTTARDILVELDKPSRVAEIDAARLECGAMCQ